MDGWKLNSLGAPNWNLFARYTLGQFADTTDDKLMKAKNHMEVFYEL